MGSEMAVIVLIVVTQWCQLLQGKLANHLWELREAGTSQGRCRGINNNMVNSQCNKLGKYRTKSARSIDSETTDQVYCF